MLFDITFGVLEIRESGATVKHYLRGSRQNVKKDVEMYKKRAKRYEMLGKNGMIVWV